MLLLNIARLIVLLVSVSVSLVSVSVFVGCNDIIRLTQDFKGETKHVRRKRQRS